MLPGITAKLLCPWHSPGKDTGVGCHSLLQGIFPTQGVNLSLLWVGCMHPTRLRVMDAPPRWLGGFVPSVTAALTGPYQYEVLKLTGLGQLQTWLPALPRHILISQMGGGSSVSLLGRE